MRMTPRVIVKKLIRRWSISSSARCCDRHALLMISWFTTMSQKNVSDNGSDWCSDTTRRRRPHTWKLANIVPIPKPNKDTDKGTSYRHISLLSVNEDTGEESSSLHNSKHTKHTHATQVQNTTLYSDGTGYTK